MEIQSTRFGRIVVDDDRLMTFPQGLLGFPDQARYALVQTGTDNYFYWLQAVEDPNLAFVVTDPNLFFKDYDVPLREETRPGPATGRRARTCRCSSSATRSATG